MGVLLDKKQIWVIFLSSKWVIKKQRQLATSATRLAQELLMNIQCCGGSRTFAKEMRASKMRSLVAGLYQSEADNDTWEPLLKLMLLQLHEKLPKNSVSTILWSFGIWSKLKRVKKLDKWVPHELTANEKNPLFEVWSSLILCNNKEPFFRLDWSVTQSGLYTTTGDNQLSGWMEKKLQSTSQSQTCTK